MCEPIIHETLQTSTSVIFQKCSVRRLSLVHYTFLEICLMLVLKGRRRQLSGIECDRELRSDVEPSCVEKDEKLVQRWQ
jgi:hypothetical protein